MMVDDKLAALKQNKSEERYMLRIAFPACHMHQVDMPSERLDMDILAAFDLRLQMLVSVYYVNYHIWSVSTNLELSNFNL